MPRLRTLPGLFAALFAAAHSAPAAAPPRPNVLLVLFDDLGYSDLGCYGGEIPTPHIDALAKDGLRFTDLATSARCCPTRASLLTGVHPAQAGIPNFHGNLSPRTATLAEVLKAAGYGTYAVGKWHVGATPAASPVQRGFDAFYGYTAGHSQDQWNPARYRHLPEDRPVAPAEPPEPFYATDAFTAQAQAYLRDALGKDRPWFLYLAHSSPHFPLQAPAKSTQPFVDTYRRGWDVLRQERFERMKALGLADHDGWRLSPPSRVPVEADDAIANGFSGKPNPAWDSLDAARREDLARRMALYAAMVKHVDDGVGRLVEQIREAGQLANTLILILSDNGACYEWGPFGFDGVSRSGRQVLHEGQALAAMGTTREELSYGSAWANLSNTPYRLYKHFTHQGGISSPLIAHWPAGIARPNRWVRDPAHVMDILPTLSEVCAAPPLARRDGHETLPVEGTSLAPLFRSTEPLPERAICIQHEGARSIRKGRWKLVWGKRFPHPVAWELYDLAADPCELNDLAAAQPERVAGLAAEWQAWADRTGLTDKPGKPKAD